MTDKITKSTNSTIDIAKLIMAILVVAIHTEPFSFNIWLDRGLGIITRLCVPFFFVAGSYFFFGSKRSIKDYITRMLSLYFLWTIIYLPFDLKEFRQIGIFHVLKRIFWDGNRVFWYIYASVIATLIVVLLKKYLSNHAVLFISFCLLAIGCASSTYSPVIEKFGGGGVITLMNFIGTRNGLFYAPAYVSLGMVISEQDSSKHNLKKNVICFCGSMILLILESILFIVVIRTEQTILWLSVFPASYFLYKVLLGIKIELPYTASIFMRKLSTLIYAIHGFFLMLFENMSFGIPYFLVVSILSAALGAIIIVLSEKFKLLKYLY